MIDGVVSLSAITAHASRTLHSSSPALQNFSRLAGDDVTRRLAVGWLRCFRDWLGVATLYRRNMLRRLVDMRRHGEELESTWTATWTACGDAEIWISMNEAVQRDV